MEAYVASIERNADAIYSDPRDPAVVTVGTFHAGLKENIIPDSAEIALNVRTPTPEVRDTAAAAIDRACMKTVSFVRHPGRTPSTAAEGTG